MPILIPRANSNNFSSAKHQFEFNFSIFNYALSSSHCILAMDTKHPEPYRSPSLTSYYRSRAHANAYDKRNNPRGIVSLGIEENTLMSDELSEIMSMHMKIPPDIFDQGNSSRALTTRLLRLYNGAPFNPNIPVEKKHIYFTAGCSMLLEQLFRALCNEREGILIGRPSYFTDIFERCKMDPIYVSLKNVDLCSLEAVQRFEEKLQESSRNGMNVRMMILPQPFNVSGKYITPSENLTVDVTLVTPLLNTFVFARNTKFTFCQSRHTRWQHFPLRTFRSRNLSLLY
jgi:Aminotransferase class I and II